MAQPLDEKSQLRNDYPQRAVADVQNTFPCFSQTGDTKIVIKDRSGRKKERHYLLHSLILAQNSQFFAEQAVDNNNPPTGPPNSVGSGRGRELVRVGGEETQTARSSSTFSSRSQQLAPRQSQVRYELDWSDPRLDRDEPIPLLVPSPFNSAPSPGPPSIRSTKPPPPTTSFFRNLTSTTSPRTRGPPSSYGPLPPSDLSASANPSATTDKTYTDDLFTAYDNLLLIFYNHAPNLDKTNIATAYVQCKLLLSLASLYSALPVVGPRVDHHLLGFSSRLWKQIAKYPPSYLKLGYLARSRAIFKESLVHVVGQWPAGANQLRRGRVDDLLVDLIEDKADELAEAVARVDARLFRLSLSTSRGERVGPHNAYVDWLAVSLFRSWFAEQSTPAHASILKDSPSSSSNPGISRHTLPPAIPGRPYRLIASAGQAYLPHEDVKKFLKLRPDDYSRDNLRRFERRVDEIKNLAREVVRPVVRSSTEAAGEWAYLTCTKVGEGDLGFVWGGGV
ncbi:MAG: hypothetical protein M1828_003992 [Chrysothrix sp. TS-e1954]|nr:MAG: hypothetical protein M1828_003992 [Chrysothrix sp. TS-e1954]